MKDIETRLGSIALHVETIAAGANGFVEHYRAQLIARIAELAPELVNESSHRLETEALLYAERSDVTEEITRLRSHLAQFAGIKNLNDEAGKRMDFILQEMNREVNTVGSKAEGPGVSEVVVSLKAELEKMREQVQNVE